MSKPMFKNFAPVKAYFRLTDEQESRLTNQHKNILFYIYQYHSITPMEAFTELYVTKLSTRISEMKVLGIQFDQKYESKKDAVGQTVRYMRYRRAAA